MGSRKRAGPAGSLSQLGVKPQDLEDLAKAAHADACLITNPREALTKDIKGIYEEAL
jgi:alcohol dehydrogenase class IV